MLKKYNKSFDSPNTKKPRHLKPNEKHSTSIRRKTHVHLTEYLVEQRSCSSLNSMLHTFRPFLISHRLSFTRRTFDKYIRLATEEKKLLCGAGHKGIVFTTGASPPRHCHLGNYWTSDLGYGRGGPFWAFYFSG